MTGAVLAITIAIVFWLRLSRFGEAIGVKLGTFIVRRME